MSNILDKDFAKALGKAIKNLRENQGWNQEHLAKELGRSRETISHIEGGRQGIGLSDFCRIAQILGKHPAEFLEEVLRMVNRTQIPNSPEMEQFLKAVHKKADSKNKS